MERLLIQLEQLVGRGRRREWPSSRAAIVQIGFGIGVGGAAGVCAGGGCVLVPWRHRSAVQLEHGLVDLQLGVAAALLAHQCLLDELDVKALLEVAGAVSSLWLATRRAFGGAFGALRGAHAARVVALAEEGARVGPRLGMPPRFGLLPEAREVRAGVHGARTLTTAAAAGHTGTLLLVVGLILRHPGSGRLAQEALLQRPLVAAIGGEIVALRPKGRRDASAAQRGGRGALAAMELRGTVRKLCAARARGTARGGCTHKCGCAAAGEHIAAARDAVLRDRDAYRLGGRRDRRSVQRKLAAAVHVGVSPRVRETAHAVVGMLVVLAVLAVLVELVEEIRVLVEALRVRRGVEGELLRCAARLTHRVLLRGVAAEEGIVLVAP
mmetsp:Transcript_12507/g.37886  ORF Transcript_12507/g.37886 Transcript_12507/m.37886 type:complete len:382 (+) Transcript_12507:212-1357(+)